jgi:CPA2 family monovalent cation:H+ antiporter-2
MSEVAGVPIVDVGAVVLVALVLGALFGRLRLSTAVGYILAGVLLGPLGLHYLVPGQGLAPAFGKLGLLMLLFYLGLELSLKRLRETGAVASLLAFLEMVVAFAVGFAVAKLFGLGDLESLVIAAMLPATSTVHAVDFILERGLRVKPEARLAESALVLQDFAAILVVVFLSALGAHRALNVAALNALLFVVAAFFLVSQVSKRVLAFLESIGQSDKMALYAIGVGIGVAYFGVFLGLEAGIGAYFAGFALAETIYGERIKRELRFLREFFILFFFVSFGAELFVDPASGLVLLPGGGQLAFLAALALALLATYVLAKVLAYAAFGTALGLSGESALTVGALMMPIGEFALIIAAAARPLLAPEVYQVVFSLAFVLVLATAVATPLLYARVHSLAGLFARFYPPLLQRTMRNGAARLAGVEALLHDRVLHTEWWRTARSLFLNLLLAISIVYLSNVIRVEVVLPLLPFVPASIGIGALILPLVAWPVYRIIVELRFLTHAVAERFFAAAFPLLARRHSLEHQVSEVFTGLLLTAVGVFASAGVYYAFPQDRLFLLLPVLYTLLSLMFFSKALYGSLEEFAVAEATLAAGEGPLAGDPRLRRLSLEFNERARRFQQLHLDRTLAREQIQEALLGGDVERARRLLFDFRQREAQHAAHLAGRPSPALGRPSRPRAPAPRESLEALLFAGAAARKPARRPARKPERARAAAKKPARRGRLKTKRG